jgi:hypothetical protein
MSTSSKKRSYHDFFQRVRHGIEVKRVDNGELSPPKAQKTEQEISPKRVRRPFVWRENIILRICSFLHANEILLLYCLNHHWHSVLSDYYYCDDEADVEGISANVGESDIEEPPVARFVSISFSSSNDITPDFKIVNEGERMVIDLISDDDNDETQLSLTVENQRQDTSQNVYAHMHGSPLIEVDDTDDIVHATPTTLQHLLGHSQIHFSLFELENMDNNNNVQYTVPPKKTQPIKHNDTDHPYTGVTLFCDDFFIRLTEPYWTLCLNPECYKTFLDPCEVDFLLEKDSKVYHCYYIEYNRPLFSVDQFLKLLRFFKNNPHLLERSGIQDVCELFFRLHPYSVVAITDRNHVQYLIEQVKKIAEAVEETERVVHVGNLAYLCAQYIDEHKNLFKNKVSVRRKQKSDIIWKENRIIAEYDGNKVPIHIDQVSRFDVRRIDPDRFVIYDEQTVHLYQRAHHIVVMCMESLFVSCI